MEYHAECRALLGTVALGVVRVDVRLSRVGESPAVAVLTLAGPGRPQLIVLNNERAFELSTLIRHAVDLITGRSFG